MDEIPRLLNVTSAESEGEKNSTSPESQSTPAY